MRKILQSAMVVVALGSAMVIAGVPAQAAPYSTAVITSPAPNTIVYKISNISDGTRRCDGRYSGTTSYTTPIIRIAPKSTANITVTGVPAGNYSTSWSCDSFSGGHQLVMVTGSPTGTPRVVPDSPVTPGSPGMSGSLGGFGSS